MKSIQPKFSSQVKLQHLATIAICLLLTLVVGASIPKQVQAAPVTGFNAGRIIDDAVFTNSLSMDASQIQAFLSSKVPVCETWHAAGYGQSPPFTCLKDYKENGKSAAQIIYDVAQQYQINPQVFIVLLQKEQGLVTDTWPLDKQYKSATGYGCPDTAPCDSQYYGLTNQLVWSGKMFRSIMNASPGWYTPYILGNNFIRWSPTASCGGTNVNIENRSTQALYNYTPYQPNQAALNAGYGNGDSCSAYGNRNFFQYFKDWFGSTYNPILAWQPVSLNIYDEGKNIPIATDGLHAGERVWVSLKVKNIGSTIWYKNGYNPAVLGVSEPRDRASKYCDTTWISCNRVTTIREPYIAPGEEGHFEFYAAASNIQGEFREYFTPLLENKGWMMNDTGFHIYTKTNQDFAWQWGSLSSWSDSTKTSPINLASLSPGQTVYTTVFAKNTSATIWQKTGNTPIRLATSNPKDRRSGICESTWLSCNRLSEPNENLIRPGETASFSFTFKAPQVKGEYREYIRPVLESKGWTTDSINHIYMKVQ